MLFSSLDFLLFLPVALLGFFLLGGLRFYKGADLWLVLASLFFYGWWNPKYLLLIIPLVIVNYGFGLLLFHHRKKLFLWLGVMFNLTVLGYFKYANFFINNVNEVTGADLYLQKIILPLGISFFTFQKIAYLVDMYRGEVKEHNFLRFSLFVLFFPQLIAGPIVHHKEIIPQFRDKKFYGFSYENFSVGMSIFVIGLFKKLVLADNFALYVSPVFLASGHGMQLGFFEAWGAALCYTFQLYFDFSGYSDMATGVARMFGVTLPVNFNSPYKSRSIIDFWRRWHISLSRFLRDYVYIPLGGNRKGKPRRYANLFVTMLLAGIWHGAGWTFFIWGLLHAGYLCINHAWRALKINIFSNFAGKFFALLLTFLALVFGWVIFRAENLHSAFEIIKSMCAVHGISVKNAAANQLVAWKGAKTLLIMGLLIVWLLPNSFDIMEKCKPVLSREKTNPLVKLSWNPSILWALAFALMALASVVSMLVMEKTEFLYFNF